MMRSHFAKWRQKVKHNSQKRADRRQPDAPEPPRAPTVPYDYAELHKNIQIRILHLQLGHHDEQPLIGDLECRMLHDERPYLTLSYVWGKKDLTHRIKTSSGHSIFITESLFLAILDIRNWARRQDRFKSQQSIPIWADAICINQAHVEERNVQVGLMSTIYSRAQLLITYLGPSIEATKAGIDLAAHLHTWLQDNASAFEDNISLKMLEKAGLPDKKDESWIGLIDLFSRTWYSRVWLLQESVLSQEHDRVMLCGRHALPRWPTLIQLWSIIFTHGGPDLVVFLKLRKRDRMSSVAQMITMRFLAHPSTVSAARQEDLSPTAIEQLPRRDWSNLLFISHFLQSQDPRDKIYGLLGLVEDVWMPSADYDSPPEMVYEDVCVSMLEQNDSLDFLYCVYPKKTEEMELPSWVPDWSHVPHDCPIPIRGYGFSACGNTSVSFAHDPATRTLTLKGIVIDTINDVILESDITRSLKHHRAVRSSTREELAHDGSIYRPEDIELFWSTTSYLRRSIIEAFDADITATGLRTFRGSGQGSATKQEWRNASKSDRERPNDAETMDEEDAETLRSAMEDRHYASLNFFFGSFSGNRPLLRTSRGVFGLGPRNMEIGDVVVVFLGARTPFIIRKRGDSDRWQFKGFALMDGHMHGEALDSKGESQNFAMT